MLDKIISGIPFLYQLINRIIGWCSPLGIIVDNKNLYISRIIYSGGFIRKMHPIGFFIDINFTNRKSKIINVLFSDFEFCPKKTNNIEFEIHQRIYEKRNTGIPREDFFINPGSKFGHIYISMKLKKDWKIEDFLKLLKKNRNTPTYLKFNYIVSEKSKKPYEKEINNFFNNLLFNIKKSIPKCLISP